ncbi:MAG: tol-pal system protein YbgF [Oceanospirillaceae bacterium]
MKVFKVFCVAALLANTCYAANQIEVIQVTEGAGASNQRYDLVLVVQQLQAEVRQLRGLVESQQYELNNLKQQQNEMYTDLDTRLGGSSYQQNTGTATNSNTEATSTTTLSGDEQQDYSAAFSFVKSQELQKAESAFQAYIKRYPKAKRVSNAVYWLGEVNLAQGKLPEASGYFQSLMSKHPKSAKIPDAMYKLGRSYQRMGEQSKAQLIWQQLLEKYPKASAANLAKSALN